jgi:uncharacterized protein YecT (DUF1311 family)
VWLVALLAIAWTPGRAETQPKGPAFDCSKAQGEVEQLICRDEGLAALDRKLDEVYKAALAKARDDVPRFLRTEQRGWIGGRNECWKAKDGTYLTASWQAKNVRECVEGNYRIRISELQALMRLVPPKGPVFYACNDAFGEVVATFFETDPPTVRLERGDETLTAWRVPAASGAKYEGQNVELRNEGDETTVTWLGAALRCRAK